ncbi:hypothetical protein TRVL_08139 [Trypanosoma vivax]|nr:hypothetical protein TRVL_08139 [Trypanosoma vivax]
MSALQATGTRKSHRRTLPREQLQKLSCRTTEQKKDPKRQQVGTPHHAKQRQHNKDNKKAANELGAQHGTAQITARHGTDHSTAQITARREHQETSVRNCKP